MKCPKCGKKMVKKFCEYEPQVNPPQHHWYWWCGCGHVKPGGVEPGKMGKDNARERWEKANSAVGDQV